MSKQLHITDENGEIVTDQYTLRHRNQDVTYRKLKEAERYLDNRHWVASYHDPIRRITQDLSLTEAGAIIKLMPYLRFKSEGRLIKDGKPLKQADIQRIFKRGKTATKEILDTLTDKDVITILKEGRSNVFYISAEFHTMGSVREDARFTKLYKVRTQEVAADLALHEAGLLYKILPYFHYERYYLCANPNEPDPEIIRHMNREQLAEAVGIEPQKLNEHVSKLRSKGALLSTKSGKSVRYIVHPDVMFRQSSETAWTNSVREMFREHGF